MAIGILMLREMLNLTTVSSIKEDHTKIVLAKTDFMVKRDP